MKNYFLQQQKNAETEPSKIQQRPGRKNSDTQSILMTISPQKENYSKMNPADANIFEIIIIDWRQAAGSKIFRART
jgi:hypothetical protein